VSSPATEELPRALRRRQSAETRDLVRPEQQLGKPFIHPARQNPLEVNPQLATAGDRIECHTISVGDVEAKRRPARVCYESGLAVRAVSEPHIGWAPAKVATKDDAEPPARCHKSAALFPEAKRGSPRPFVRGEPA